MWELSSDVFSVHEFVSHCFLIMYHTGLRSIWDENMISKVAPGAGKA